MHQKYMAVFAAQVSAAALSPHPPNMRSVVSVTSLGSFCGLGGFFFFPVVLEFH